jgi:23S rRNA (adenine2030-N6)-methyltransferase
VFAYRHAFHAGNHADVFKHLALIAAVEFMQQKEGPVLIVDTHAGAGLYPLKSPLVRDKAEWSSGIGRLWELKNPPAFLTRYLQLIRSFNRSGRLTHYPGSPVILQALLRPTDKLRAYEMHPSDIGPLQNSVKGAPRQVKAERKNGFDQLRALLPPASRRGLVLIDPPYELREDYTKVVAAVKEGLSRFSTGVYMIWVPQIARFQVDRMIRQLTSLGVKESLLATLTVRAPQSDGLGLQGSSLLVLNPPFGLKAYLEEALPFLVQALGQDNKAGFEIKTAL